MTTPQQATPRSQGHRRDRNSIYEAHNNLSSLRDNVERSATSRGQTLAYMVQSTKEKLADTRNAIQELQDAAEPWDKSQVAVSTLLSPLREVGQLVNAIAEAHPCTKVIAKVVIFVVEMELSRRKNDMQIAITFYEMSICILILADLDHVYVEGAAPPGFLEAFEVHLKGLVTIIREFGGFCAMYYERNAFVKMCKSSTYKDKLTNYAAAFDKLKRDLHLDISTHASLKVGEIDRKMDALAINIEEVKVLLLKKTQKEQYVADYINAEGGLDAVLTDERKRDQLSMDVHETIDAKTLEMLKEDFDRALARQINQNELLFEYACGRLEKSFRISVDDALSRKLEEGAHQLIEDAEIRDVWRKMKASTSVKTRVFLNALQEHFLFEAVKFEAEHGVKSPNHWALHFLSKMIFYPAIGDVLDEDLSGFVSLNEVNNFLMSRPAVLKCNSIQWIAFWGFGPYKTNVELVREIKNMLSSIEKTTVRPEHERCMQYFKGITQRLGMISVHTDIVDYLGDTETAGSNYGSFEEIRQAWRTLEMRRIERNLGLVDYTLPGAEAVVLVLGNRRLEHYIIFLVHALLRRQLKVINFARHELISVREFIDMRMSWECLFRVFDERLNLLLKVWRQHRLDLANHVETYAGGLFEEWYHFRSSVMEDTASDGVNVEADEETPHHHHYHHQDHRRRISIFQLEVGQSPLIDMRPGRLSPIEPVGDSILNYDRPKFPEDESSLVIEQEVKWRRRADIEREEKAKLNRRLDTLEEKLDRLLTHLQLEPLTDNRGSALFRPARSDTLRPANLARSASTATPVLTEVSQLSSSPENSRPGSPNRIAHENPALPTGVEAAWQKPRQPHKQTGSSYVSQATSELPNHQQGPTSRMNMRANSGIIPASLSRTTSVLGEDHIGLPPNQTSDDAHGPMPPPPPPPMRSAHPLGSGNGTPVLPAPISPPAWGAGNPSNALPTPPTPFSAPPGVSFRSSSVQNNPSYSPSYTTADPYTFRRNSLQPSSASHSPALHSRTPSNTLPLHAPASPFGTSDRSFTFPVPHPTGNPPNSGYATPTSTYGDHYGSVPHTPQYGPRF